MEKELLNKQVARGLASALLEKYPDDYATIDIGLIVAEIDDALLLHLPDIRLETVHEYLQENCF